MNLSEPRRLDLLAAEYVLGTQSARVRRRFGRLLEADPAARTALTQWEQRLAPLAHRVAPITPRADSWPAIARRLGLPIRPRVRPRRWLAPLALAAAVGALAVGVALWVNRDTNVYTSAAVVTAPDGHALWRIDIDRQRGRIRVAGGSGSEAPAGRDYELWALPTGGAPVSLGLLPAGRTLERALSGRQRAALAQARQVAVSLEPRGGSSTGAPTGPVVHVAPVTLAAVSQAPAGSPG